MSSLNERRKPSVPGGPMGRGGPRGPVSIQKPKNTRKTAARLIRYIGSSRYVVLALLLIVFFMVLAGLVSPYIQGEAVEVMDVLSGNVDMAALMKWLILLAASYLTVSLLTYLQGILAARLSLTTVKNMRHDLFARLEKLPISFFDTHQHGDIMSRMTNDVENVSNTISQSLAVLFNCLLSILSVLAIMLVMSPWLTLVAVVTIPLSFVVSIIMGSIMRKYFKRQQKLVGELNGHIEEMVTGYKTLVAFNKQEDAVNEFADIADRLKATGITANFFGGMMGPLMNIIGNLNYLLVAAMGGYLSVSAGLSLAVIQSFLIYSKQLTRPINEVGQQWATIQTALAGAERIFEVMDELPETDEGRAELRAADIRGDISFNSITFSYKKGEPVLKGFELKVRAGEKIAIVGSTGAGKTTVVNLLTRFYEIDSGSITVDGVDITDIPKETLRKSIAIVLQDTVLFNDTIRANIMYGREDATEEDMKRAARLANADVFIERLPEGYDTVLSEAGGNLSQGQRQLLAIARAVLADPKILILDEATSSVDTRTEMHIQQAMINLMANRTNLIIAHRLSTIRDADKIIVVAGGKIAEQGSHGELLEKKGHYYQLYQNQFAGLAT